MYVVGILKNRLTETVLFNTKNNFFLMDKKIVTILRHNFLFITGEMLASKQKVYTKWDDS